MRIIRKRIVISPMSSLVDTELVMVDSGQLGLHWPNIARWVIEALKRSSGRYNVADVYNALATSKMVAFAVYKNSEVVAVCIVEVAQFPSCKALSIIIMVGKNRNEWLEYLDEIEDFGRGQNCEIIEAWARPGWEKVLPDWKKTHVLLEKTL